MTQSLAKYHGRSPRYILNTEDDSLIRLAGPKQVPWEEGTEIQNVSLTGLAFTAPSDLCPILGEVIKIQFLAPGGHQLASYAIVTRVENKGLQSLVAIHFYKMEMGHRIALAQGLAKKLKDSAAFADAPTNGTSLFQNEKLTGGILAGTYLALWCQVLFMLLHYRYNGLLDLFFK